MKKFAQLFRKVGGKEILRQYIQAHVLLFALVQSVLLGFSKKSLEIVRLAVNNRILGKLRKKYCAFIEQYKSNFDKTLPRIRSNKVWICWLQGIDNAPELVQKCCRTITENLPDREVVLITEANYRSYVTFPRHIQEKIDRGVITRTHFSDLLRLELLNEYGGTWIDATVYLSGKDIPEYMLDSDLFLFQDLKPGFDGHCTCISSWFMTACTNHPILMLTKELLYEYWKKNTRMVDYFLLHDFFQLAIEAYPEEWSRVVPFSNSVPHILLLRMFECYDEQMWEAVKGMTCVHKLSYKFEREQADRKGTYYDVLFGQSAGDR